MTPSASFKSANGKQSNNVNDKIRNDILPFLNQDNEDDTDELDDEVAQISNKQNSNEPIIDHDDIDIRIDEEIAAIGDEKDDFSLGRVNLMDDKNGAQTEDDEEEDPENTRNFNTLPRNYSDPANKNNITGGGAIDKRESAVDKK